MEKEDAIKELDEEWDLNALSEESELSDYEEDNDDDDGDNDLGEGDKKDKPRDSNQPGSAEVGTSE